MRAALAVLVALIALETRALGEDLFSRGNERFAAGKYAEAASDYGALVSEGRFSAPIFFNLGNACFKQGRTGEAILNYERALWLAPRDPDARANLRFVRQTAGLYAPSQAWWELPPSWLSLNAWAWMASGALFALAVSLGSLWLFRAAFLKPVAIIAATVLIFASASAAVRLPELSRGVVLKNEAPLRVAPLEKSPANGVLRAGEIVEVRHRRDSYRLVRAADGKTGWVSDREAALVVLR